MGKKCKNPRKAARGKADSDPLLSAVDKVLAQARPREEELVLPSTTACSHMTAEVSNNASKEEVEVLRKELKAFLGGVLKDTMSFETFAYHLYVLSVKSRIQCGKHRNMLDVVVATATTYLLQYDCSLSNNAKMHRMMVILVSIACALDRCDEKIGLIEEKKAESLSKKPVLLGEIADSFQQGCK